jgi:ABC-type transporter Mla subunit MlaD
MHRRRRCGRAPLGNAPEPVPRAGVDTGLRTGYESGVAKKADSSRIPSAVGAIPVVGDLMKSADVQAQWMQDLLEQNARLIGQFPATMKTFNDSIERFNQTIARLDRAVSRIEAASKQLTGPLERVAGALDQKSVRDIPEVLEALRKEALPALRAATDTQRQVAMLQTTVERVMAVVSDLPGAGIVRRMTAGRGEDEPPARPKPGTKA